MLKSAKLRDDCNQIRNNNNKRKIFTQMTIDNASEDRKPRLIIQKLVLENFKSYAGVIEIGPFEKVLFTSFAKIA
jgi:structural maintenance of chromosome 4